MTFPSGSLNNAIVVVGPTFVAGNTTFPPASVAFFNVALRSRTTT